MPIASYLESNGTPHAKTWRDASEHTRFIRMAATVAPFISQPNGLNVPKGGFNSKSGGMQANRDARLISPVFGTFKTFAPNNS